MFIMSRRLVVEEKINKLTQGYNAYAETEEIIRLMKREISKKQISVICDQTDNGCWFIPTQHSNSNTPN
ncbi:hypothetical protein [Aquibacillus saliphilus]|uniref:hypothetical protein n=1 Tax=Aquibacillus saliphilus TaxID=1909422 RepID=UPI001CF08041|nr:hypothetical protein [Aquibacillus saliphilus]